jgi:hypothetical protein
MPLLKIISGGQTGVDRGALDAALAVHFPCGGRCPAGRKAEDGTIPENYPVTALRRGGYRARTLKNVQDSDGTLQCRPAGKVPYRVQRPLKATLAGSGVCRCLKVGS